MTDHAAATLAALRADMQYANEPDPDAPTASTPMPARALRATRRMGWEAMR